MAAVNIGSGGGGSDVWDLMGPSQLPWGSYSLGAGRTIIERRLGGVCSVDGNGAAEKLDLFI